MQDAYTGSTAAPMTIEEILSQVIPRFHARQLNCAETVLYTMAQYYGWQHPGIIPQIATPFGGGLAGTQRECGALTGGLMVLGILLGRDEGGDKMPAYQAGKALIEWFVQHQGNDRCRSIIDYDLSDPEQNAAFSAPGGRHETICEPLAAQVCQYLASAHPREGEK